MDMCGPWWPEQGPKTRISKELESFNSLMLQHFSRVERMTGIEPALSAWELTVSRGTRQDWLRARVMARVPFRT